MNFDSRVTLPSNLPEFDGVSFTFNKMTEGRRIKLRLAMADCYSKLREITEEAARIAGNSEADAVRAIELHQKANELISNDINPMWVRWG
jgi:hypothetical protein